ncbi:MAG: aconitate hydratase B, partial [Candidatus Aminicenantales bacterium]
MLESYLKQETERQKLGIPPLPLNPEETAEVCRLLESPPAGQEEFLLDLIKNRVSPGVDPAAEVKAAWLARVAKGEAASPLVPKKDAVFLLGTMLGGYNVGPLVDLLDDPALAPDAAEALKHIILVYGAFDAVVEKSGSNLHARSVLESWAAGEWFLKRPGFPDKMTFKVFKVDGEINTDDFSPAKHASTRPDIPLHSLAMGETCFPGGIETIRKFREEGHRVVFVGDVVGTGSSRKSACNSVMWHIGEDIPYIPNKRRAGVVIGGLIAPIFFNTTEDSGGLPLLAEVGRMKTGDLITLDTGTGEILNEAGEVIARFEFKPPTLR